MQNSPASPDFPDFLQLCPLWTQTNECGVNPYSSNSAGMDIQFYPNKYILAFTATWQCKYRQLSGFVWIKAWIFLWGIIGAAVFCSLLLSSAHLQGAQSGGNRRFILQNNADWSPKRDHFSEVEHQHFFFFTLMRRMLIWVHYFLLDSNSKK